MNKKTVLMLVFAFCFQFSFTQESDSDSVDTKQSIIPKANTHINGSLTFTTNGISTIPYLSLGKPAFIGDMSLSIGKFSFDPELKFDVQGVRPWAFVFWFRYRLIEDEKVNFRIGMHPAYSFKTHKAIINETEQESITVWRFWAGEIAPKYFITPNLSVGPYYLYSYNMEKNAVHHTHFLSLQANLTNLKITNEIQMTFFPQVYYLKVGQQHGYYAFASIRLSKNNFPFSLSATANKEIKSDVAGSESFLWNASLTYSFGRRNIIIPNKKDT